MGDRFTWTIGSGWSSRAISSGLRRSTGLNYICSSTMLSVATLCACAVQHPFMIHKKFLNSGPRIVQINGFSRDKLLRLNSVILLSRKFRSDYMEVSEFLDTGTRKIANKWNILWRIVVKLNLKLWGFCTILILLFNSSVCFLCLIQLWRKLCYVVTIAENAKYLLFHCFEWIYMM